MRRLRDLSRVKAMVERDGISVPSDLHVGSHLWRAHVYATLCTEGNLSLDDKAALADLFLSIQQTYRMPWTRTRLVPLDESRHYELAGALMGKMIKTSCTDVVRACLWQIGMLREGKHYTDDHVLECLPKIKSFCRRTTV